MFFKLLFIFVAVPLLELLVIIEVSSRIGLFYTLLTLLIISFAGAALAKQQGYQALGRLRQDFREGRIPGDPLIDGALVLSGALLLLTPGYVTDAVGLVLLIPPTRKPIRALVRQRIERGISRRTVRIYTPGGNYTPPGNGYTDNGEAAQPEQRRKELDS